MKRQFDRHHGAKHHKLILLQEVMIQLHNGRRVPGTIVKFVGRTMAQIRTNNGIMTRHFNQIWNRLSKPADKAHAVDMDILPSVPSATEFQHQTDMPTFTEENRNPVQNVQPSTPATEPDLRHSKRLFSSTRSNYRTLAGTRSYAKHRS